MPASTAVRYKEKSLLDLFDRTFAKHGIKMKSYVAVQKKLLVLIYHIWKKNEKFDPNYTLTKALLQEELNLFIEEELAQKNSPNQVEAIPDKQISKKNEVLSIS